MKQSFSWWSFVRADADPAHIVREAARIGYAAAELVGEEHWPLLLDHGLKIAAVGGHRSLSDGLNRRENHDRIVGEVTDNLQKAIANGIPNLLVFSGNRNGLDDTTGAQITAEGLARLAPLAEQAGVTLVMELLNSRLDHKDYQADHTDWGVHVCRQVDSPRVRLLYDIYHMQVQEGDVIARIRQNHDWFAHYHTAGVPGRRDLDDDQELHYPAIVRAIRETGYGGYLGHEFRPKGDPVEALAVAFRICAV